jgi:hypothetical protein
MRRALLVVLALALLSTPACSKKESDSKDVLTFVDATENLAQRFVYTEQADGVTTIVQGLVEDDFRYKTKVSQDGHDVLEQVISDDTAAVRFLDPTKLAAWVDKGVLSAVDQKTDLAGVGVLDALRAQRWVSDEGGAPGLILAADKLTKPGEDPILDARTNLEFVRQIAGGDDLTPFIKFNPDSISPTYREDEDPFPKPEKGSGVDRYDVAQPGMPSAAEATSGAEPFFASAVNFRKLAVYVKDGRIIQVREYVGLTPRLLRDLRSYLSAIVDATVPEKVRNDFHAERDRLKGEALGKFLLAGLNTFIDLGGDDPIRFRARTLELRDLGAKDIKVDLPSPTIKGSLAVLKNLGRKPIVDEPADGSPKPVSGVSTGGASASPTTTIAG